MLTKILTVITLIVLVACSPSGKVSQKIGGQVRSTGEVTLSTATEFEWDTVYIFSPYTGKKTICKELSSSWSKCNQEAPADVPESAFLMVFTLSGSYTYHELHSRINGEFCHKTCILKLSKAEAVFKAIPSVKSVSGSQLYDLSRTTL